MSNQSQLCGSQNSRELEIIIDTVNLTLTNMQNYIGHESGAVCSKCHVREICMPIGISSDLLKKLDELVYVRRRLKSGATLYHAGSNCHALYAVKTGFIKTENLHYDGKSQITGFYMAGEIFGFDGLSTEIHMSTSVALEDSEICVIPIERIHNTEIDSLRLQQYFYKLMSREIIRDHTMMMVLGSMQGEERVAAFVLNLSQRFKMRGYSAYHLILRMKREEIGSYLGIKIETVSRIFTKFQAQGLLDVHQKDIRILNLQGLKELVSQYTSH